ncbi:hypothetical protein Hanom_Chr15g01382441 [Helianthus anomalus]
MITHLLPAHFCIVQSIRCTWYNYIMHDHTLSCMPHTYIGPYTILVRTPMLDRTLVLYTLWAFGISPCMAHMNYVLSDILTCVLLASCM